MNTIEDVPLFGISLKIVKFCSFLIVDNWRRYVCLIPYILSNITQFADLYYSKEKIDAYIRNTYVTLLFCNCIIRSGRLCIYRRRYEDLMNTLRQLYIELMNSKVLKLREMLIEATNSARLLGRLNLVMGIVVTVGFVAYPFFAKGRVLPFAIFIPGIDKYKSPCYEIFFALHTILAPIGCCMYIPFTNLMVAFIIFGILMCKVLQYELRHLKDLPPKAMRCKLIWCIRYHYQLASFIGVVNGLNTFQFLIEFMGFGAMVCAMLFSILLIDSAAEMFIVAIYIVMLFSQSVALYYYADELYLQSLNIAVAAYDVNWYELDISTQKVLQIFMQHAQKPCSILVGNVYPMNLQLLQTLLNTTYSYFAILRRFYG